MRPVKKRQSAVEAPLNRILGTEANVRTLRVLVRSSAPLYLTHVAVAAGLTVPGCRSSLATLTAQGVVERVRLGRRDAFKVSLRYVLAEPIAALFGAERLIRT